MSIVLYYVWLVWFNMLNLFLYVLIILFMLSYGYGLVIVSLLRVVHFNLFFSLIVVFVFGL